MRKILFVIFIICLGGFVFISLQSGHPKAVTQHRADITVSPTSLPAPAVDTTLFVPYWTLSSQQIDQNTYNRLIYFGVTVNSQGIDTQEDGYNDIDKFLAVTSSHAQRLLCVRMINTDINNNVLADQNLQQNIIHQSIALAQAKGFDGIVLDFEISALGFDKVTNQITSFEDGFADTTKNSHLLFLSTIYGDTFARFRPFDVKEIAKHADGIFVMAYDFHKAGGDPGPNFPFSDAQDGYSFPTMTNDFLANVSPKKMTVIFGLFGYDWTIDDKGNSVTTAVSLSDNEIKQKFLDSCAFTICKVITDPTTAESHVLYTDTNGKSHVVWFEDMQSAAKKKAFLTTKNIGSIGYWAYSYF